jgi:hypothetical protein
MRQVVVCRLRLSFVSGTNPQEPNCAISLVIQGCVADQHDSNLPTTAASNQEVAPNMSTSSPKSLPVDRIAPIWLNDTDTVSMWRNTLGSNCRQINALGLVQVLH